MNKLNQGSFKSGRGGGLAVLAWLAAIVIAHADPARPTITNVQLDGTNVVVTGQVPAGIASVTLEGRARLQVGAWVPRAVAHLDSTGGAVTFRLAKSQDVEVLRLRADQQDPLPASFYQGTNAFLGQPATSGAAPATSPTGAPGAVNGALTPADSSTRAVVESDIWEINGTWLYFFNQYRGLQVVDISDPSNPVLTGTLSLPAAGEQMYLLSSNYVALLAQDGCGWSATGPQSRALIINVMGGKPQIAASVPVSGQILESRMVGTALYIGSAAYLPVEVASTNKGASDVQWQWNTLVSSFDLADPAHPVARSTINVPGYSTTVTATDQFLFVATQNVTNWWQSQIQVIDISAPDGTATALTTIDPFGTVQDKYKMAMNGDTFSVISYDSRPSPAVSRLQTFSMATPTAPKKLGELLIGHGDSLFATRFDGARAYIVTYYRVDPLWVVDLSDPANPTISGQLQVPGYSTYIQPLGDRLVTLGIDTTNGWQVAVSLFDVHDAAHPALLSKVPLGDNYSWSEATYDDKAFGVLPDAGLILVPYQGYFTNGFASRVQLIDLNTNSLVARGTIEHQYQPRRSTVYNGKILSISGMELLSVDAADRAHPAVKADLELSWPADVVFLQGKYLLQLASSSYYWTGSTAPAIRVSTADDPDTSLNRLVLTNVPFLGAAAQSNRLYIAQGNSTQIYYPLPADGTTNQPPPVTNTATLTVTVFDLSNLPQLTPLGQTNVALGDAAQYWGNLTPIWPQPGLLVWAGSGGGIIFYNGILTPAGGVASSGIIQGGVLRPPWWPWWGGFGGKLLAFDVSAPATPKFLSQVDLSTTNGWWSFSQPYAAGGLIYLSHQGSEFLPGVIPPGQPVPTDKSDTNQPPPGTWIQRWYLDVVDYADPVNPTVRPPVNIPGTLNGVSQGGALLYTVGNHYDPTTWTTDWTDWLDASAYDGVAAHLVDSLHLSADWPHPVLVQGENLFIGSPGTTNSPNLLQTWTLPPATGRFSQLGALKLSDAAQSLSAFGPLLAGQSSANGVLLLDATTPAALSLITNALPDGCVGFNLNQADGALDRGLWIPLSDYGVWKISR